MILIYRFSVCLTVTAAFVEIDVETQIIYYSEVFLSSSMGLVRWLQTGSHVFVC